MSIPLFSQINGDDCYQPQFCSDDIQSVKVEYFDTHILTPHSLKSASDLILATPDRISVTAWMYRYWRSIQPDISNIAIGSTL